MAIVGYAARGVGQTARKGVVVVALVTPQRPVVRGGRLGDLLFHSSARSAS
ncbi:MAG: hypothetical protein KF764_30200 [Labilithrix sp.]|nr:hypothetical protein [Labilithrix sp.]MBX3220526.1 hypothetical protein [Labilithrix sp.]